MRKIRITLTKKDAKDVKRDAKTGDVVASKKERIERDFGRLSKQWPLTFYWKDLRGALSHGEQHDQGSDTYFVSAMGKDRTGIVYAVSDLLARYGLNITDLNSRRIGQGSKSVYAMMLEVDIPKKKSILKIEKALKRLQSKLKIELRIKPTHRLEC